MEDPGGGAENVTYPGTNDLSPLGINGTFGGVKCHVNPSSTETAPPPYCSVGAETNWQWQC
jgi:hypothetical protein